MKELETIKLWYNRYLYKVVIFDDINFKFGLNNWYISRRHQTNDKRNELLDLLENHDARTRNENGWVSVFTNDKELIKKLYNKFNDSIQEIWEPDPKKVHVLKQPNTIIVKDPARHPIRVTLNDKKISSDFTRWISANTDKVTIGNTAFEAIKRGWMTGGLYFYLRDDKILGLVNLMISQNIRRIDRLVYEA